MDEFEFTQRIRNAVPQAKDIERALKIKGMSYYRDQLTAANKQIKTITDEAKFDELESNEALLGLYRDNLPKLPSPTPLFSHTTSRLARTSPLPLAAFPKTHTHMTAATGAT